MQIFPCENESAMRRSGGKTLLGGSGHAAGDQVAKCCDSDFNWTTVYIKVKVKVSPTTGRRDCPRGSR